MDLREKKTKRAITNAFLQLRKQNPLERIRVTELAAMAEISKATFYLHYRDIFDLNETLQEEVIQNILSEISQPEYFITDKTAFIGALVKEFCLQQSLIEVLFSGNQAGVLPMRIEKELRSFAHTLIPNVEPWMDMMLTYQIQGGFFVSQEYKSKYGMDAVVHFLSKMSEMTEGFSGETLDFFLPH